MKTFNFLGSLLFFATIVTSCSQDEILKDNGQESKITLSQSEYISIAFDSPKEISEDKALNLVKDLIGSQSLTRNVALISPEIKGKYYLTAKLPGIFSSTSVKFPVYEVSLNTKSEGGYALVSGDERVPAVIAYVEEGSVKDTITNKGAAFMIQVAQNALLKDIAYVEFIKDSLRTKTLQKIASTTGKSDVLFDDIKDQIIVDNGSTRSEAVYPQGTLLKEVKNLIKTKWDQCSPYNIALDNADNSALDGSYQGKNAVGCTGVAIAQLVAHFECLSSAYGTQLNWSDIKYSPYIYNSDEPELKNQVANLCKHVALGIGTSWNRGVGSASVARGANYLSGLGVSVDTGRNNTGYDLDAVRIVNSLDILCPVIITGKALDRARSTGGGGHCWLLDGYQLRKRTLTREIIKANDTYIHANFGWGGNEDGFYMVDRNTTSLTFETLWNGHYNQNLKIYPNVRRK